MFWKHFYAERYLLPRKCFLGLNSQVTVDKQMLQKAAQKSIILLLRHFHVDDSFSEIQWYSSKFKIHHTCASTCYPSDTCTQNKTLRCTVYPSSDPSIKLCTVSTKMQMCCGSSGLSYHTIHTIYSCRDILDGTTGGPGLLSTNGRVFEIK